MYKNIAVVKRGLVEGVLLLVIIFTCLLTSSAFSQDTVSTRSVVWIKEELNPAALENRYTGMKVESVTIGDIGDEEYPVEGILIVFKEEPKVTDLDALNDVMSARGYVRNGTAK